MGLLVILGLVVVGVIVIAILIASIKNAISCMIIKILVNIFRIIIVLTEVSKVEDGDFLIDMSIITAVLTLYGFGESVFQDTLHETGNLLINPTNVGYKITNEIAGDTPIGNFISAIILSAITGVISFVVYAFLLGYLKEDFGLYYPPIIIFCSLSVIGIIRSIITFIQVKD